MDRPIRIMLAAVGTFVFTAVIGWLAMNTADGWLFSMATGDPLRQRWQPRIQFAESHIIELMALTWLLLFGLCWMFTNALRGKQPI